MSVYEHPDNDPIWAMDEVGPLSVPALQWIGVAGREVHIHRRCNFNPRQSVTATYGGSNHENTLNPQRFLADEDIWRLRVLLPDISGPRQHIAGFITLLVLAPGF